MKEGGREQEKEGRRERCERRKREIERDRERRRERRERDALSRKIELQCRIGASLSIFQLTGCAASSCFDLAGSHYCDRS